MVRAGCSPVGTKTTGTYPVYTTGPWLAHSLHAPFSCRSAPPTVLLAEERELYSSYINYRAGWIPYIKGQFFVNVSQTLKYELVTNYIL